MSRSDFAIKSSFKDRENFLNEAHVLKKLASSSAASPLVQLLCTFEQGSKYYMVFPWAECNLYKYWERNPNDFSRSVLSHWR